ncbi:uncharacterized protein LOC123557213 isoform X2 [Mercenaria mercenaria]|uniref:uncharacterized protein LOC123557213 isoform X2 n=1 Tax=Mercenaria mercenaria TaxID=6596 RepID=UPI00234F87C8|nr:uncharacterized protein LOC123557213 isoform X2 [Mercenaria mercenaria]
MKPEDLPVEHPKIVIDEHDETNGKKEEPEFVASENKPTDEIYDGSADGFHGKLLPAKNTDDNVDDDEESDGTFITAVKDESEEKKMISKEEEDLGIYEDTDDNGDDLSDTELELERLRAEKKKREQEEKDKLRAEQKLKQQIEEAPKTNAFDKRQAELTQNIRSLTESAIKQIEKQIITPRTDISMDSRLSSKSWSDPRFLQGISIRDLYWKTDVQDIPVTTSMKAEIQQSRNASRLALESREAMFRRAMSLLSARCTSVRQETDGDKVTLGAQIPKYFYVTQDKPQPMEPLKAWRGYHGNIYFEPININPLKGDLESERARTSITRKDPQPNPRTRTSVPKLRSNQDKENRPFQESRSESRQTNKSSVGSRRSSTRPMAYLDKQTVLNRLNESIQEDIVWLEGTENTGSLAVRPKSYPEKMSRDKERDLQYNKERIKKGSVAHKLYIDGKSKQKPKLSVSGGKFTPPNSLSPLLRTQTQYSLSSQRLTTNSPDPYHLNESKLPPLDQIRASLKHMDSKQPRGKLPYNKSMTITDDMKPFVKYSPDVVAKFAQQANIC